MLGYYIESTERIERFRLRPLGPYLESLAAKLHERAYTQGTGRCILGVAGRFNEYVRSIGIEDAGGVGADLIERFINEELKPRCKTPKTEKFFRHLVKHLRAEGVISEMVVEAAEDSYGGILGRFDSHLRDLRGLRPLTRPRYLHHAKLFLDWFFDRRGKQSLTDLTGVDILDFITEQAALHPSISIQQVHGNPPDRYQIRYNIRSLVETVDGEVAERVEHSAEFYLTLAYPRQAPQCRMLTPVFHPNIAPHAVCIGDHWAAGEALLHLIIRVGEMLAFQSYNTKSPLNGAAARWVDENIDQLPTDNRDLMPGTSPQPAVANLVDGCGCCGSSDPALHRCQNGHEACLNCLVQCGRCNNTFCQSCSISTCVICARLICDSCRTTCPQCRRTAVCAEHMAPCSVCGEPACPDCIIQCSHCGKGVCLADIGRCKHCPEPMCRIHLDPCQGCQAGTCQEHLTKCDQCDVTGCPDCIFTCQVCEHRLCLDHVAQCGDCKEVLCDEHRFECNKCGKAHCAEHLHTDQKVCWNCGGRRPVIGP